MKILVCRSLSALVPLGSRDPRVRQLPVLRVGLGLGWPLRHARVFQPRLNSTLPGPAAERDGIGADCAKRWLGCVDVAQDLDD